MSTRAVTRRPSAGRLTWLGTGVPYHEALELQRRIAVARADRTVPDTLLLLEHAPVYTAGRRSSGEHILRELDAPLVETDRGGQVTFHGPGQLVAYPVVDLRGWGGPVKYVRALEQVIIGTLQDLEVQTHVVEGRTGVWVSGVWGGESLDEAKIAAIGVKISRGVAFHGLSINVNTDLSYYENIVPCGIEDKAVTSMAQVLGVTVDEEAVRFSLAYRFGRAMGFGMTEVDAAAITGSLASKA